MSDETVNLENLHCEYSQVNQNFRSFSFMRLAIFCFYFVVFFAAIILTFSEFKVYWARNGIIETVSKILWFFLTLIFLGIDIYFEANIRQFRLIGKELEERLGLKQFGVLNLPKLSWLNYVVWAAYAIFLFFWVVAG